VVIGRAEIQASPWLIFAPAIGLALGCLFCLQCLALLQFDHTGPCSFSILQSCHGCQCHARGLANRVASTRSLAALLSSCGQAHFGVPLDFEFASIMTHLRSQQHPCADFEEQPLMSYTV
jgi:hypothetical protein